MGNKNIPSNPPKFEIQGEYRVRVIDVYDGDTFTVSMDIGCGFHSHKVRLMGVDCPEMKPIRKKFDFDEKRIKKEKKDALAAKEFVEDLILDKVFIAEFHGAGKFGRLLADIKIKDKYLSELIIENGHGYEYTGGTKKQK